MCLCFWERECVREKRVRERECLRVYLWEREERDGLLYLAAIHYAFTFSLFLCAVIHYLFFQSVQLVNLFRFSHVFRISFFLFPFKHSFLVPCTCRNFFSSSIFFSRSSPSGWVTVCVCERESLRVSTNTCTWYVISLRIRANVVFSVSFSVYNNQLVTMSAIVCYRFSVIFMSMLLQ